MRANLPQIGKAKPRRPEAGEARKRSLHKCALACPAAFARVLKSCSEQNHGATMSELTTSQKIAQLEKKIARLRQEDRKLENGQKIIIGGMMLTLAKKDPKAAQRLLDLIEQNVTRDIDKKRLEPLVAELREQVDKGGN